MEKSIYYSPIEKPAWNHRQGNYTIHVQIKINNVTSQDEGYYEMYNIHGPDWIELHVYRLYFINQTSLETIVGQEGESIKIVCSSDTGQLITSLVLESIGTIKAIGDNQSVSFSFIPDRTDHLRKYTCKDSTHSSIMIQVDLIIKFAPAVTIRYTNATIECDCDGFPPIYSMYRLDRISKYGELVYSVNLTNETFIFKTDQFPYQRNGRYMCVVSNGIPGTNGKKEQNSSIHINYEGPPVFAKENRYVNHGKVGQSSIRMSFSVYSCPDVDEIFLQKLGRMRGKKKKLHKYDLKSILLYNELDNETGVPGYYILIESDDLDIEDFQAYIITVTNRLGASEYHFEIIKKEDREIDQREKKYVFTICIVAAVLYVSIIIHIGFCVNRARTRVPIHSNMNEDRTYHTYNEIGTISHGSVSNVRLSETNDNQGQNLTQQHAATFSNTANVQTTDNDSNALHADFANDNLQQRGGTCVQEQHIISLSADQTNIIDDREQSSDKKSQTNSDSDSESSETVMAGNAGDGYENPYQTVLHDHQESHQYTQITTERNTRGSSVDSYFEMQTLEKSLTKEEGNINLQF
ncbi:Hypothetical predicted protein [Mytilus galloprovincialis]|uniref:Ig-like domain-containing protein n=1 Tax=Mytilus galloprovincialis TaxID=29158 RepID=A0A8B6DKP5_MYTGA|nr:Hypothetical predicted protein [Mytilus galloprovincialis]